MTPDVRAYLEARTATAAGFSPDGTKVLVSSNLSGTAQLFVVPRTGGAPCPVTDEDEPVTGVYLPTSDEIVVSKDAGGNERLQLYLARDDGTGLRPLVHDPDHIHRLGGVSRDGRLLAYASEKRNGVDFDVYVHPVGRAGEGQAGESRLVFSRGGWCQPVGFSPDGRWLGVVVLTERNGDNDSYLVDLVSGEVVHASPHDDEAAFGAPAWLPDSSGFFFATDSGRDLAAVARYDLVSRSWRYVLERPSEAACAIDRTGTRLLVTTNVDGCTRAELVDPTTLASLGEVPLPGRGVADFVFSEDGRYLAYGFTSALEPGDAWVHDCDTVTTTRLTTSPRTLPAGVAGGAGWAVEPTVHRYASFDGESIPAFLYRPRAPAAREAPVVVVVHGGPESQYTPGWNPLVQYFVARGYAVVAPNVRGSTGYGKRFSHLDDVRKRLDSVADLAALHDWLVALEGVDAGRAALYGGSYGGYMVLAGLAFQPERWAAGVDVVGISSLVTFLENTAAWRRAFREREYGSLEHDRDFLVEASPLTQVERMRAPLFVVHGANDPRVPLSEAEQVHRVLTARGVRCELLVYPDEGHGLAKLANRLDAYPKVADFLDAVLGST